MKELQTKEFYAEFFEKLDSFTVKAPFDEIEGGFSAIISPRECVHPVEIQVFIPRNILTKKVLFGQIHCSATHTLSTTKIWEKVGSA